MSGLGPQRDYPTIPAEGWREQGACRRYDARLWWDSFDDKKEADSTRAARLAQAKRICNTECPVRKECSDSFDWRLDDGVRGGHETPPLFASKSSNGSLRNVALRDLLSRGIPLDDAVATVRRDARKAS